MTSRVSVEVTWDMGHRLPKHNGACSRLHGHTYRAIVTFEGPVKTDPTASDCGMVLDFKAAKAAVRAVVDLWDHSMLISMADPLAPDLKGLPGVVLVDFVPTAEMLSAKMLRLVAAMLAVSVPGVEVVSVVLYEQPTSKAEAFS